MAYLGRPKNNVAIGIVGMPNVGKSCFFNCLSSMQVASENFAFCTIKPAECVTPLHDPRFDHLVKEFKPKSVIPAVLNVTDIAGLVKGAHDGQGLGNEFLANIAACDAIFHMVRAFASKKIEHVEGNVDPCRDLEIISEELRMKDMERLSVAHEEAKKAVTLKRDKSRIKENERKLATLTKAVNYLESKVDLRMGEWTANDIPIMNTFQFLTAKPVVYLVNVGQRDMLKENEHMKDIREWCKKRSGDAPVKAFSAPLEHKFRKMTQEQKDDVFKRKKIKSNLADIIYSGYKALHLIHYFTCGADEVRAWTVRQGSSAPQAAGVIHGDFQTYFKHADQYHYDAFKEFGGETEVRKAGKFRQQGKNYIVQDGDILLFTHTAPAGGGKKKK